jgi:hypothetical protein
VILFYCWEDKGNVTSIPTLNALDLDGVDHACSAMNACEIVVFVGRRGGVIVLLDLALASASLESSSSDKHGNYTCCIIMIFAAKAMLILMRIHLVYPSLQFLFLTMAAGIGQPACSYPVRPTNVTISFLLNCTLLNFSEKILSMI